jgi:hypothetical protein
VLNHTVEATVEATMKAKEFPGCVPWRSLPSDRVSEIREERYCELDELHPDETRLLATPEIAQIEGRNLAKHWNVPASNLGTRARSTVQNLSVTQRNGGMAQRETP